MKVPNYNVHVSGSYFLLVTSDMNIPGYIDGDYIYHRLDGPAVEIATGDIVYNRWFYMGVPVNVKSQEEFEKVIKMKLFW